MTEIRVEADEISRITRKMFDAAEGINVAIDSVPQHIEGGEITDALLQISAATTATANRLVILTHGIAAIADQVIGQVSVTEEGILAQLRPLIGSIQE
ncbi:hypothetical protein [Mycetocola saprophilus]|uniref:hypothetical protein n=1 Tax=Mycetocola saprophilus TaxID=76636 RepID=UPI0012DDA42A|nr:hypothetical protein [Mycetocola saprophilus]